MNKSLYSILLILLGTVTFSPIGFTENKQESNLKQTEVTLKTLTTTILTTGTVEPQNRLEIKPPITGRVEEVLVQEGDNVEKGQLLAWMSSSERAALLDAARAISQKELDKWQTYYKPTPIYAPINGTVILRDVEPGQTFSSEAVFVLSDRLAVKAQVDETDLAKIRRNQKATIVLDAYPNEKISGYVSHIAYEATIVNNVTTYTVDVIPNNTPSFMRSGMTANVTFNVETKENIPVIPQSAITYKNGKPYVKVPSENGKAKDIIVKLGISEDQYVEVLNGIKAGDKILYSNTLSFNDENETGSPFMPNFKRKK